MTSTRSKKKLLRGSHLYVIADKEVLGRSSVCSLVNKIKDSGVDIIQLRGKESKKEVVLEDALALRKLLLDSDTFFIINDYLDIAKILDCDGVHLGQTDTPIEIARGVLGKDKVIGVSCHSLRQAQIAQDKGADYISIGPIFATSTKPEYKTIGPSLLKEIIKEIKIPFFAIGGINKNNVSEILSRGVKRIAVCSAVCGARNPPAIVKYFSKILY
jgi:thiamine-phosphate pyrophosphorylase